MNRTFRHVILGNPAGPASDRVHNDGFQSGGPEFIVEAYTDFKFIPSLEISLDLL